jgi:Uncharacterised nucleotidyltransferase
MTAGLLTPPTARVRLKAWTAAAWGQGTQVSPVLDVMFSALRDPVPEADLALKAGQLSNDDWQSLAGLAIDLHRVGPRVWRALGNAALDGMPSDVAVRFETDARQANIRALTSKAETARVVRTLNQVGIEPCLLKGWALEEDLSGAIGQRVMHDLDLMIKGHELPAAAEVLQKLGYRCALTRAYSAPHALESFTRFAHHIIFFRPASETLIELHVRPFRNEHLLPLATLRTEPRVMKVSGSTVAYRVPTLAWNFVYLALHGYVHRWERAKWLVDFPPLLRRLSGSDWQWIHQQAKNLAIERTLGIALALSRDFLEADIPGPARPLLDKADGSFPASACRRELLATEPYSDRPTLRRWLESHVVNLSASPRFSVIGASFRTLIVRESDVLSSDLASRFRFLHYLYAVLHIPQRIGQRVLRRILRHGA